MKTAALISEISLPVFIVAIIVYGLLKRVDIYAQFIAGAKGGIQIVFRILPYIVGMIFALEIFKASGCFDAVSAALSPLIKGVGIPPEVLPLFLMRPFSGSASMGLLAGILSKYGPDTYIGRVASTYMGSSESLFYTVSLYLGSVGITKSRYVIPVSLITDAMGLILSCLICRLIFGG